MPRNVAKVEEKRIPMGSEESKRDELTEVITATNPAIIAVCATVIACFAISSTSSDSVKIAFAGAAGTGLGVAGALGRPPNQQKGKAVQEIGNAENIDVSVGNSPNPSQ